MKKLTYCLISDTHTKHIRLTNLLPADIIIHGGDISSMGYEHEIRDFLKWFSSLEQYKYKIFIAGNHDWLFQRNSALAKSLIPDNVIYLEDSGVEIDGVYIYGTPVSLPFYNWAFMKPEDKIIEHWKAIPDNTDILITHTPPYGILDYVPSDNVKTGSITLRDEILNRIKPKLSIFGHIHEENGITAIDNTLFVNASSLNDQYLYSYEPRIITI